MLEESEIKTISKPNMLNIVTFYNKKPCMISL